MNKPLQYLAVLFLLACCAHAQLGMKLTLKHKCYLTYEPVEATLTLRNYSGNTLVFGDNKTKEDQGKLTFGIKAHSGRLVSPLDIRSNPLAGKVFAPGQSATLTVTLNHLFNLQRNDFYKVTAFVEHKRMPQAYQSEEVAFEVKDGNVLSSKVIGLPTANAMDYIKSITATLLRFNDGENDIYCLRIDDDNCVYGTFRIGPYINGSVPQLDADGASAIHVLVQVRPKLYSYAVYSIIGGVAKLRQKRYLVPDNGVPTLSRAPGYLKILYARKAVEGTDYILGEEQNRPSWMTE